VTCAWGKHYVDKLLDFTLASALAPGNVPSLACEFPCEVAVVTEERYFDYVRAHPVARRLEQFAKLRLLAVDDLVTERWQYGMSLAYALFRGVADVGAAMTDTFFLFLNSDFVLADGSYRRLLHHIEHGERAVLAPSYCTSEERVRAALAELRGGESGGVLSVPPRRLAQLILRHAHNTVRAKTVNQDLVHFQYMDQFYWQVDPSTLIGHQMPISLIGMRPEVVLADIETFWDWGLVYDFCPSRRLTVLGDSDEFLMLELRGADEHRESIFLGAGRPGAIASRMTGYITQYQIDNARFELTLHSRPIPAGIEPRRARLRAYRDEVLRRLPVRIVEHRNHQQWVYQKEHFRAYRAVRPPRDEAQAVRERLGALDAERALLAQRLEELSAAPAGIAPRAGAGALEPQRAASLAKRAYRALMGRACDPRPWHPYYLPYRQLYCRLRELLRADGKRVLLICDEDSVFASPNPLLAGSRVARLPVAGYQWRGGDERFELCLIDIGVEKLGSLRQMLDGVAGRLEPGAVVLLHSTNDTPTPRPSLAGWVALAMMTEQGARLHFTGSWTGRGAMRLLNWAGGQFARKSVLHLAGAMAALSASVVLALLALAQDGVGRLQRRRPIPGDCCTAVTIELDNPGAGAAPAQAEIVEEELDAMAA
jgi:hypothetical protein